MLIQLHFKKQANINSSKTCQKTRHL